MNVDIHRDFLVWQKAMELVVMCYEVSRGFPSAEQFGLTSQLRRAAVSIPANIAEGHGRKTTNAFLNHLSIANGSLMELETHLTIAERLGYVTSAGVEPALRLSAEVGRMLNGLRKSLR